ncbi:Hypothetical predicted protein [Lecanosticta acicola]|uniref:Uncharacterized protein n=1 Tax=Lecanosticta acicola TaxID=111012 RepID=A0AAI8Z3R3_9PEZI|nr:Hypothetical predicted protein [Lecanosticta acicola]
MSYVVPTTDGPITKFPANDLRPARRFISSHNAEGKGVFVGDDDGAWHRVMCRGRAVANIIYSTDENPVDMNKDKDLAYAANNEARSSSRIEHELLALTSMESPDHRAMSLDYGVVIEGKFELSLPESGESKIMLPGDCSVNRGCMHKWKNLDEEKSGRMLFILLDVKPYFAPNGVELKEELNELAGDYADLAH